VEVFSQDGNTLGSASRDKTVKLWDAEFGAELRTQTGRRTTVHLQLSQG
jgi:WD40 repeat protein